MMAKQSTDTSVSWLYLVSEADIARRGISFTVKILDILGTNTLFRLVNGDPNNVHELCLAFNRISTLIQLQSGPMTYSPRNKTDNVLSMPVRNFDT